MTKKRTEGNEANEEKAAKKKSPSFPSLPSVQKPRPKQTKGPNATSQTAFLNAYTLAAANVTAAAKAAKINPSTHYAWLKDDPSYPERFEAAKAEALRVRCDAIEEELYRRGVEGWTVEKETVEYGPDTNGGPPFVVKRTKVTEHKISDACLIFAAKAELPEKYGDKTKLDHSGGLDTGTVHVVFDEDWCGNDAHEKARNQAP